jgi:hypothetical protein
MTHSIVFLKLTGEIPHLLGDLKELRSVSLSGNRLRIPGDLGGADGKHPATAPLCTLPPAAR